jgi:hypothetical protein
LDRKGFVDEFPRSTLHDLLIRRTKDPEITPGVSLAQLVQDPRSCCRRIFPFALSTMGSTPEQDVELGNALADLSVTGRMARMSL